MAGKKPNKSEPPHEWTSRGYVEEAKFPSAFGTKITMPVAGQGGLCLGSPRSGVAPQQRPPIRGHKDRTEDQKQELKLWAGIEAESSPFL